MSEAMKERVTELLKGIDRYNPENLPILEHYVHLQTAENTYDLEANLAVLKLYQFNPSFYQIGVTAQILLKSLTNLPHADFILCKCLIDQQTQKDDILFGIVHLADLLEMCMFKEFWRVLQQDPTIIAGVTGFEDSIRKFICHTVNISYQTVSKETLKDLLGGVIISDLQVRQWISTYGWKIQDDGSVSVANQEDSIKTKNITEKITFESITDILAGGWTV